MLIITRRPGERIILGEDVVLTVMEVKGQTVRIGIEAPRDFSIYREEIWEDVKRENEAAAATGLTPSELKLTLEARPSADVASGE